MKNRSSEPVSYCALRRYPLPATGGTYLSAISTTGLQRIIAISNVPVTTEGS